jgi:hypothetical protein
MKCPECGGTREVTRKILWFLTVRRPCPRCTVLDDSWHDDHWRRTDHSPSSFPVSAPEREDASVLGSGGQSGGAGASARWGDAAPAREDREAPVIVDPFAAEALTAESTAGSDHGGWEAESSSSDSSGSGADGGTAY